jgi:cell division protein FtsL
MVTLKVAAFFTVVGLMPVVAQMDANTAMEKMAKGTTQTVLAVVVICLALALMQIYKLHRKDAIDSREELKKAYEEHSKEQKGENEKLQKIIADNTSAMMLLADSDKQLKDAIYHLARVVDKNGETADKVPRT